MNADRALRLPRLAAGLWIAGLAAYVVWRAFALSMTCDEAWTANALPYPGLFSFVTPSFIAGLNVHLLNSWCINLCLTVFGDHDWAVRLPALAGGLCCLGMAYRLSSRLFSSWAMPAAVVLMTANPYLLDFFSIGRGYGLGLGFLLCGLHGLLQARPGRPPWHLAAFALAALSNLSFLYPYLTAVAVAVGQAGIWAWRGWRPRRREVVAACLPVAVTLAGLGAAYGQAVALASKNNEYWWGSADGFIDGSLASLMNVTLYGGGDTALSRRLAWTALGLVAALVAAALATRPWRKEQGGLWEAFATLLAFGGIVWAGVSLEHVLFHTPYIIERGMLFFWPLLALTLACGIGCLPGGRGWRLAGGGLTAALCLLVLGNFAVAANLSHTATWRGDACSRPFMRRIQNENYPRNFTRETIGIAVSHMAIHTVEYYVRHLRMAYVDTVRGLDALSGADYAVMPAGDAAAPEVSDRFAVIRTCPANGLVLLRRK